MSLARIAIERQAVTLFLVVLIVVGGVFSFFRLGWLEDPDFSVKTAVIVIPYPGASAEDVENEVTDVIESALQEMPQVKELYSLSRPGSSLIRVDINPRFWAPDLPQVWDEMRRKINDARPSLPPGVGEPVIGDDFGFVFGFLMAITGDGYSYAELETFAEGLQTQLGTVPGVARVALWGVQQRVIYVDVSEQQLATFGISPQVFAATLSQQNMVVNAGGIDAQDQRFRVAPTGAFTSPEDIERLVLTDFRAQPVTLTTPSGARTVVAPSGTPSRTTELITIGDLGSVSSGYASPPTQLMRFNTRDAAGRFFSAPAIGIAIANAAGGNVVQTGRSIDERLRQLEADLPLGIQLHRIAWQSDLVVDSIRGFMISLSQAVAIVLLVLIVPVGWRIGIVIGTALLLTLLATFIAMAIMGENLHRMSLGALVIALGMMVDNAIVVADNFLVRIQKGMDRKQAAIESADLPAWPLLGATIVAVLAFFPIYLSEESAGEYTRALFTVVGISLLLSWLISLTVTPLQLLSMVPSPQGAEGKEASEGGFYRTFRAFIVKAVRFRFVFVASMFAGLVIAIGAFDRVPQQFFPDADRAQFMLDYWAPEGTRIQQVAADTREIEERLLQDPRVVSVSTFIGSGPPRFYLPVDSEFPYPSYANMIVNTSSADVVPTLADETKEWLVDNVLQAVVRVRLYALGPSNPWKFQARIIGPSNADLDELRALGEEALRLLDGHPWLAEARVDWRERVRVVEPIFNDERARWAGVARDDVASSTRRATDGVPVGLYREGNTLLPIMVRHVEDERNSLATLDVLQVQPSGGAEPVPLSQVTSGVEINWENPILARYQKRPTITVEAEPIRGVTLADFMASVRDQFEAIPLPPGYELFWDGEYADSNASQASLIPGIVPAVAIMLLILIALFNAFRPVAIILLIIPFVFIGISPALLITQAPFGFVALLGAMSLSGMMIKNAVVLFDEINQELGSGKSPHQAIVDSAISRTRPVLLAAGTTVLGVIPLLSDVFFRSLALTIMGGLLVGSMLTLVMVPVLYVIFYRVKAPGTQAA